MMTMEELIECQRYASLPHWYYLKASPIARASCPPQWEWYAMRLDGVRTTGTWVAPCTNLEGEPWPQQVWHRLPEAVYREMALLDAHTPRGEEKKEWLVTCYGCSVQMHASFVQRWWLHVTFVPRLPLFAQEYRYVCTPRCLPAALRSGMDEERHLRVDIQVGSDDMLLALSGELRFGNPALVRAPASEENP